MTSEYCVLLGDVVDSRKINNRNEFQNELSDVLSMINERYSSDIYGDLKILKGIDEIGGVLNSVSRLGKIQRDLARAVHPEQIRLAAVIGEVDVNVETRDVSQMDGQAFARADMLLSRIEKEDLTFHLDGVSPTIDGFVSDIVNLLDIIRSDWSERKIEVISEYERLDNQQEVANSLNISHQAVSKHLRDSGVRQALTIEDRLIDYLQLYPSLDSRDKIHGNNANFRNDFK